MPTRTLLQATFCCIVLAALLSACGGDGPEQATVTATASAAPHAASEQGQQAVTTRVPAGTPQATAITTAATATPTATLAPAQLAISETLNIRSGPGLNYPIGGAFSPGAIAAIEGRSADEQWWKVTCPVLLEAAECWVTSDPQYSLASAAEAVAALPAPPVPPPSPTPSPTPCRGAHSAGWSAYQVREGDTLSAIARRIGAGVEELKQANCLKDDTIYVGQMLLIPKTAEAAVTVAPPVQAQTGEPEVAVPAAPVAAVEAGGSSAVPPVPIAAGSGTQRVVQHIRADLNLDKLDQELASSLLGFIQPGGGICTSQPSALERSITVGLGSQDAGRVWEPGEMFGICLNGFSAGTPVTVTVRPPRGPAVVKILDGSEYWRWVVRPDAPDGPYRVAAEGVLDTSSFRVGAVATQPHLAVLEQHVTAGMPVSVVLAGYPAGRQPLYLCWEENEITCATIEGVVLNDGATIVEFATSGLKEGLIYAVHDGDTSTIEGLTFGEFRDDPRQFMVIPQSQ